MLSQIVIINSLALIFLFYISRKRIKVLVTKKVFFYFKKLPMKENRVVFSSFSGKGFSDSPKYLYNHCRKNYSDMVFIWVINDTSTDIPGDCIKVKHKSLKHLYYMATSKFWFFNSRIPALFTKREGQVYLQTWHGTPLKQLGLDMDVAYFGTANYKHNFYKNAKRWDYLISANNHSTVIFQSAFGINKEKIIQTGYPRNDILINHTLDEVRVLREKLQIPKNKKVILYCPTWRDDEKKSAKEYGFELKLDLRRLKQRFGSNSVLLLRMHYLIAQDIDLSGVEDFAFDVSSYDDIQELYLVSDLMITDYSSTMFDYTTLKRPVILYCYDFDKYKDVLRGFYFDLTKLNPGPIVKEHLELEIQIEKALKNELTYNNEFYHKFCSVDDGFASDKTLEILFGK